MRKLKWLPSLILTGLMGYGCGPSISGAPIGLPDIRIPVSALPFLCRDVDSPLGVTPTTNVEKWLEVRSAFGLPDSLLRLHTAPARTGPRREGPVKLLLDSVAMSGANNERHDCQGLIGTVNGADKYTAFVTLWVSSALARTSFPERTVVAGITLAGDDYSPLRLRQTRNCVILQGSDPNDDGAEWRAWILNIHHDQTCDASHAGGIS